MRLIASIFRLSPFLLLAGCAARAGNSERIASDLHAMPPNTVMLSQMMRELTAQPGFTEALLQQIDKGQKNGFPLTPTLFDLFRKIILGKDWEGLDRFPGWTMPRITKTVDLGQSLLKKENVPPGEDVLKVQIGPYRLDREQTESLDKASDRPAFSKEGLVENLGNSVVRGDGADPQLAPLHAESARLAEVMNRLSLNGFNPAGKSTATFTVEIGGRKVESPQQLVDALVATGHHVTVADARFFANFGHFHYKNQDVEMPFWIDTQILVPRDHWWQRPRPLLIPVAHAEYEWIVSGPKINADMTFYFGIDGRAEFRTNDQLNQPWVMKRHAHEYRGADALEVTRLTGSLLRAYAYLHTAHPQLPFGGYYTLGVCQDVVAAIEQHMTGATTIFPNTAQTALFQDQPDEEVLHLMQAVSKDADGTSPTPERIFGSLPTTDFDQITVPGLREDVKRSYAAWRSSRLEREPSNKERLLSVGGLVVGALLAFVILRFRRKFIVREDARP